MKQTIVPGPRKKASRTKVRAEGKGPGQPRGKELQYVERA
jgi:hypothetical protein